MNTTISTIDTNAVLNRLLSGAGLQRDAQLATLLGVTPQAVSQARRKQKVPEGWLIKASLQYGLSMDWLLFGTEPQPNGPEVQRALPPVAPSPRLRISQAVTRHLMSPAHLSTAHQSSLSLQTSSTQTTPVHTPFPAQQTPLVPPAPLASPAHLSPVPQASPVALSQVPLASSVPPTPPVQPRLTIPQPATPKTRSGRPQGSLRATKPSPGTLGPQAEHDVLFVPLVAASLSAGTGSLETESEVLDYYAFHSSWLCRKGNPDAMVLMKVYGDSMEPDICHNDMVLIDQSKQQIYPHTIYAVGVNDEIYIKQVETLPGHRMVLRSFNERYDPIEVDLRGDMAESVRIIGRVLWWCREA